MHPSDSFVFGGTARRSAMSTAPLSRLPAVAQVKTPRHHPMPTCDAAPAHQWTATVSFSRPFCLVGTVGSCLVGTVGSTVITIETDQPVGVFNLGKVHWRPYVPNTVAGRSDMSGLHKSAAPRTGQGHQPARQPTESKKIYRHRLSKVSPLSPEVTQLCLPHWSL